MDGGSADNVGNNYLPTAKDLGTFTPCGYP